MASLSNDTKREIGQHFVFGFHGHEASSEVRTLITDYHVGNIILMKRNVRDAKQVRELVENLQKIAKDAGHEKPLLIGIDQENGLVSAFSSPSAGTQFPGAMALAATGSPDIACDVSAASAKELKLVGISWAFSPVADINSDPRNPVIGVRSFGDDPDVVGRFVIAVAKGLTLSGVAPSAKHFPGHGDTHMDSHLALPVIKKTEEGILNTELIPFKKLIQVDVATIMAGHMALPLINGSNIPSSLSKVIITDILRGKLNYRHVVVTDCLEMDAIADLVQGGCGIPEGAVRALEAGIDIVMACHTFEQQKLAIEKVYEAVEAKRLLWADLKESGKRIEALKDAYSGSWQDMAKFYNNNDFDDAWKIVKEANLKLAKDVYSKTTAVVWNNNNVLPLKQLPKSSSGILLLTPRMESINRAVDADEDTLLKNADDTIQNTAGASYLSLGRSLGRRSQYKHIVYAENDKPGELGETDAVIIVTRNANHATWQRQYLADLLDILRKRGCKETIPIIIVASCGPYDLLVSEGDQTNLDLSGTAYVATFEFTAPALEVAVGVIFGEQTATGRIPVLGGYLDKK